MSLTVGFRTGVPAEELATTIQNLPGVEFRFMVLHHAGELWFLPYDQGVTWSDWEQGVLFGEGIELRFRRRRGGCYHVVIITADKFPEGITNAGTATLSEKTEGVAEPDSIYLWGEWDAGEKAWIEPRFPKRLPYPDTIQPRGKQGRAVLKVERLHFTPAPGFTGAPAGPLERLCDLTVSEE